MAEIRDELRRASRAVAPPNQALEEMLRRGERRRRASRAVTAGFTLFLSLMVLGGALFGLTRLGDGTARTGDGEGSLAMAAGDYHYLKVRVMSPAASSDGVQMQAPYDSEIETWWGLDDSGRIRVPREGGGEGLPKEGTYGPGEFPLELEGITNVSHLSTDPDTLHDQLLDRHAPDGASPQPEITPRPGQDEETGKLVRDITSLLTWPNVTPELRQALFEVAAGLPTVERRNGVQDPVGRDAIELTIITEDAEHTLYFDPATRLWMGSVEDHVDGVASPKRSIVLASGFVGSTDEIPSGEALFFPESEREPAKP